MEWIKVITQLLGTLVWPITVVALAFLYRQHLRSLLLRVAKIELPGASITMLDVSRLERTAAEARDSPALPAVIPLASRLISQDPNLVLSQIRTDIERELFRIAQIKSHGATVRFISLGETLRDLENTNA